jgi:hypothetical protein
MVYLQTYSSNNSNLKETVMATNVSVPGFFFGGPLPNSSGPLTGKGKRLRHVKVYNIEQSINPELKKLILAAWRNAESDIAGWRQSLKQK